MTTDHMLEEPEPGHRSGSWTFAVHCVLVLVVLGAAAFCFYECSRIGSFVADAKYHGKPLPLVTEWLLTYRTGLVMLAAFVPCAAVATFALHERWQAFGSLVGLLLLAALHAAFVHVALWAPTVEMIKQMGPA